MKIDEIKSYKVWQDFFNENGSSSFLQAWEWGEFEKNTGYEVLRLGIYDKSNLAAIAQVIKIRAKRGNFLLIPHGPIFTKHLTYNIQHFKSIISNLLNFLISLAKKEEYTFIRIAPVMEDSQENKKLYFDLGFKKAPIYMHAERLWVLDLDKSEEELLNGMRKTTRYLVRKATRDGVAIEKRTDEKAVEDFWKIYQETVKREKFVPFSKDFIKKEFEAFHKTGNAIFLFGKVETSRRDVSTHEYIASALVIFTKSTAFYHQGASIHIKVPVTYLLQWEAIKEAKKRGCLYYNFWGILQAGRTPKNWQGLTLFKTGFGGRQIDYLPTQDYIISPKYYLTYIYEKLLAWRRGV